MHTSCPQPLPPSPAYLQAVFSGGLACDLAQTSYMPGGANLARLVQFVVRRQAGVASKEQPVSPSCQPHGYYSDPAFCVPGRLEGRPSIVTPKPCFLYGRQLEAPPASCGRALFSQGTSHDRERPVTCSMARRAEGTNQAGRHRHDSCKVFGGWRGSGKAAVCAIPPEYSRGIWASPWGSPTAPISPGAAPLSPHHDQQECCSEAAGEAARCAPDCARLQQRSTPVRADARPAGLSAFSSPLT